MENIKVITPIMAQRLGLKDAILVSQQEQAGAPLSNQSLQDSSIVVENYGTLRKVKPSPAVRLKQEESTSNSTEYSVYNTWAPKIEKPYYYSTYKISTRLMGQLENINFSSDFYPFFHNNRFNDLLTKKPNYKIYQNDGEYAFFRYPEQVSNTKYLTVKVSQKSGIYSGIYNTGVKPSNPSISTREESNKNYYRWYPALTRFNNTTFSGYHIPYPLTIDIKNCNSYNYPVKIATQFNSNNNQKLNGLIVISTGTATKKQICYVSPHELATGYLNGLENFYNQNFVKLKDNNFKHLSVNNSKWYNPQSGTGYINSYTTGWLDTFNGDYSYALPNTKGGFLKFEKKNDRKKQIYFDPQTSTQYGSGSWLMCISGVTGNNFLGASGNNFLSGNRGVIYKYHPVSAEDAYKKDPRDLLGTWSPATGIHNHPKKAGTNLFLSISGQNSGKIEISHEARLREKITNESYLIQVPSIIIDSLYSSGGYVLPKGIKEVPTLINVPKNQATKTSFQNVYNDRTVAIYDDELDMTLTYQSGQAVTGVIERKIKGYNINNTFVTEEQVALSGIQLQYENINTIKYSIDNNGHFQQTTPLKNTHFYRLYKQLYKFGSKQIATGTWNGIIPSGVHFSIELISVTLDGIGRSQQIGIENGYNLSVIYSGFGTNNAIDSDLQEVVSPLGALEIYPKSRDISWNQKRWPYYYNIDSFGQLNYTAHTIQDHSTQAKFIAKIKAEKAINKRIIGLVNKAFPNFVYKNAKFKKLLKFKNKNRASFDSLELITISNENKTTSKKQKI